MNKIFHLFLFLTASHQAFSQTQSYSVFKLEKKIGEEKAITSIVNNDTTYSIVIATNDRGYALKLQAKLAFISGAIKYSSAGNTSRFKTEDIDTTVKGQVNFPISNNGSVKLKEQLIAFWNKAGRPAHIVSALNARPVAIAVLGHEKNIIPNTDLTVIELQNITLNNELVWVNEHGEAIFMATHDTESDKREVISNSYMAYFAALNKRSNTYLINTYVTANKNLGNTFANIAITGGNVVDVYTGAVQYGMQVLLKDGVITYVGKPDATLIPKNALVINAANQFLLPGLWNMHVHLFHPDNLKNELLSGVTTVRDMANEFDLINSLKQQADSAGFMAPAIISAGVLDGRSAATLGVMQANNDAEIKQNIKKYHDAGFKQIKVYDAITKQNLTKIVKEARIYNMDVVGHIPFGMTMKTALNSGMLGISHARYFMNALNWNGKGSFSANNQELLSLLSRNHVVIDPTLNVYSTLIEDAKITYYKRIVKMLYDNQVAIVAGTDNEGTIANELQHYVDAGLTPLQAIQTSTIVPAQTLNMEAEKGSIAVNKASDIILLKSNPLVNINALKQISTIVKGTLVIKK